VKSGVILSVDKYTEIIKPRLTKEKFLHSIEVSKQAAWLAKFYSCDEDKARVAGLLHDCCKCIKHTEMLEIIERSGIELTDDEQSCKKVWHAIAGRYYAESELGIKDADILDAIRYHTTGRANMSVFEKIIYVADLTSADRNFPDIDEVRELSSKNLDAVILISCKLIFAKAFAANDSICLDTLRCYNQIVGTLYAASAKHI
jgi:predicted HD superfamily hydrolase involved in NAD metabolism